MKHARRVLAIFAFLAGGFAAETVKPVCCSLLNVTGTAPAPRRKRV